MSPPRICILAESFYPLGGGVGTFGLALSRELVKQGSAVRVVTQRQRSDLPRSETVDGVSIVRLPAPGPKRLGKYSMLGTGFIHLARHRDSYDIVYVLGLRILGVLGVLAARRFGKRSIVRAEQTGEMSGSFLWQQKRTAGEIPRRGIAARAIASRNRILARADAFVAISAALREEFESCGIPANRIVSIPNGVDPERFHPLAAEARAALRRELGIGDEYTFVFAGRLHQHKGLFTLLDAWSRLKPDSRSRLLLVGGDSPVMGCETALKEMVAARGLQDSVRFVGPTPAVVRYLQAADCFVLPSEREGFSIALLEAMACGIPSVATMTSGSPELVRPGQTGELVPIGDPGALALALDRMRTEPARGVHMGSNARGLVLAGYTLAHAAARHMDLFARLGPATASLPVPVGPADRTGAHSPERTAW